MAHFPNNFADELIFQVFSYVDIPTLGNLAQVSKKCKQIVQDKGLWESVAGREMFAFPKQVPTDWRAYCIQFYTANKGRWALFRGGNMKATQALPANSKQMIVSLAFDGKEIMGGGCTGKLYFWELNKLSSGPLRDKFHQHAVNGVIKHGELYISGSQSGLCVNDPSSSHQAISPRCV